LLLLLRYADRYVSMPYKVIIATVTHLGLQKKIIKWLFLVWMHHRDAEEIEELPLLLNKDACLDCNATGTAALHDLFIYS